MKQVSNCFMVAQKCARSLEKKKIKEYIYSVHTLDIFSPGNEYG